MREAELKSAEWVKIQDKELIIKLKNDIKVLDLMVRKSIEHNKEVKVFEIDFSGQIKTKIEVKDNKIKVIAAMNGYADSIDLDSIKIKIKQ